MRRHRGRTALAVVAGLVLSTFTALTPPAATAEPVPAGTTAPQQRAALLGADWQRSGDRLWTTVGDGDGLHVLTAHARDGYTWRTTATLAVPGLDSDQWIGNACATASGNKLVVVYAPRAFTNREELFDRGGFTAVVDLGSGAVTPVAARTSLAYFNPGCGADEKVALTQAGQDKTGVLLLDATTAKLSPRIELPGQATSAVPSGNDVLVAGLGRLERVSQVGKRDVVTATAGIAQRLRPDAGGGVVFSEYDRTESRIRRHAGGRATTLATGKFGEIGTTVGRGARVYITGAATTGELPAEVRKLDVPVSAQVSSDGEAAIVGQQDPIPSPGMAATRQTTIEIRSTKTGKPVRFAVEPVPVRPAPGPTPGGGAALARAAALDTVDAGAVCSVERNDPRVQVYQPAPRQVEWAANAAVQGQLMITREAGWKSNGLGAYKPQEMFWPLPLNNGAGKHVPAQVLLGVLGQESNLWQAKRHVLPGQTGNPLVGNYYGVNYYNDTEEDDWTINWNKADCGYGVGQVTDGMRKPGHPHPDKPNDRPRTAAEQRAIGTDYAANIAASLRILQDKWNELQSVRNFVNNNDPSKIENWFFALWAYNSGYHVPGEPNSNGAYGLGWGNNPVNPKYDQQRHPFGQEPTDFKYPQRWPYPEKVIGFAANPPSGYDHPGSEVPFFRPATWPGGPTTGVLNRMRAKPPITQFCDESNECFPDRPKVQPNAPEVKDEPLGPCYHKNAAGQYDLKCWFHQSSTWKTDCDSTCGQEFIRFDPPYSVEQPIRKDDWSISYPPRCVTTGLPTSFMLIDNVPVDVPTVSTKNCNKIASSGSFELEYGTPSAKIDLHQVGGGYGAHFWWSTTRQEQGGPGQHPQRISASWTLNRKLNAPAKVFVHVPDHLANAEVTYEVDSAWGVQKRTVRQKDAPGTAPNAQNEPVTTTSGNRWVYLGGFMFDDKNFPRVRLSNVAARVPVTQNVAFDAVAFAPLSPNEVPDDVIKRIRNNGTDKCLVIQDNSGAVGAPAVQRTCAHSFPDTWAFRFSHNGPSTGEDQGPHYRVINRNSGLCLGVRPRGVPATQAVQVPCDSADHAVTWKFYVGPASSFEHGLVPTSSPLALIPRGGSTGDGTVVQLAEMPGTDAPRYFFWTADDA
ncbi:hypothetical protein N8J89_16430 [Crossiella sp. CA-258035]|uniref:RICIN domain-containing protein n=1 Tax=Crossiella sp. CA-258035 TaxID=2981138 RepID=UPI0024BC3E33|nr:hypothetical protein [Crossiella sp. CA-258035]WHT22586.1 hypothetical protein N8J89_16430 [Crossiella sp. CA-258035]